MNGRVSLEEAGNAPFHRQGDMAEGILPISQEKGGETKCQTVGQSVCYDRTPRGYQKFIILLDEGAKNHGKNLFYNCRYKTPLRAGVF